MVPLRFRLKVPGTDLSAGGTAAWSTFRIHGMASLDGEALRLEWTGIGTIDSVTGTEVQGETVTLPIDSLTIPLQALRTVRLLGGWWRPRLEITANDLSVLRSVPGEEGARVTLWLVRGDRRLAASLVDAVRTAVARLRGASAPRHETPAALTPPNG